MAYDEALQVISAKAHADYSAKQYRFVAQNSGGRVQLTGAGAQADGVLQDEPAAQDAVCKVAISGISKVSAGGSFDAGALLTSDADGDAVLAGTGDNINGVAWEAGASGRIVSVLLKCQNANVIA